MTEKASYPQWVLEQKRPGTEVRRIRGFYYLYEAKCVYDKDKKRGRKVTGKYLGRITVDGNVDFPQIVFEKGATESGFQR